MKYNIQRTMALSLIAVSALGITGCADGARQSTPEASVTHGQLMGMMKQNLAGDINSFVFASDWAACGDRVWACGYAKDPTTGTMGMEACIVSAKANGTDIAAVDLPVQPDTALVRQKQELEKEYPENVYQLSLSLQHILFTGAGTPLVMLHEVLTANDGREDMAIIAQQYTLCGVGADSTLQRMAVLQWPRALDVDARWIDLTDCVLVGDTVLWVALQTPGKDGSLAGGCYLRFDISTGKCTKQLELPQEYRTYTNGNALQCRPDGTLLLYAHKNGAADSLFTITDPTGDAAALSGPVPMDHSGVQGFVFSLDGDPLQQVYLCTDKALLEVDPATGQSQRLLSWDTYGILPDTDPTQAVYCYPQNASLRFLRLGEASGMTVLSVIDEAELAKLPNITVGTVYTGWPNDHLQKAINTYNTSGGSCFIKTVDYSNEAAVAAGFEDGMQMLQRHIVQGSAPDVLLMTSFSDISSLVRKGAFVDLYPLIADDPDLDKSDFLPGILRANEYGGTLPAMTLSFYVETLVGAADVLGETPEWTWQEYNDTLARHPDAVPVYGLDAESFVLNAMRAGGSRFIDYTDHTAHLNSPAFVQILQQSTAFPQQSEKEADTDLKAFFAEGKALADFVMFGSIRSIRQYTYTFDGPVVFKGFPSEEGSDSFFYPNAQVCISSSCQDIASAWDFVRTLLLPAWQDDIKDGFPVRQGSLQVAALAAQQPVQPEKVGNSTVWRVPIPDYLEQKEADAMFDYFKQGITAEQAQQVVQLVQSADAMTLTGFDIPGIIIEELQSFYAGVRTAAEAAAIMQDRIQTYLDEQS